MIRHRKRWNRCNDGGNEAGNEMAASRAGIVHYELPRHWITSFYFKIHRWAFHRLWATFSRRTETMLASAL